MLTLQDLLAAKVESRLDQFIIQAMDQHLAKAAGFGEKKAYYDGKDPFLAGVVRKLKNADGTDLKLEPHINITSNFFRKIVGRIAGRLWSNPVQAEGLERLGEDFQYKGLLAAHNAAIYGVCHVFYDNGAVQIFEPTNYLPLPDELDGREQAGIRFWRIHDDKPWNVQLFEMENYIPPLSKNPDKL